MKVKAYWPQASTDEPQVLALAELLQDAHVTQESDVLAAVTALAKTETGKRNDFRPTPSMVCDMTVSLRRDRFQQERNRVPSGVNEDGSWYDTETGRLAEYFDPSSGTVRIKQIASPESRDRHMAQIRACLAGTPMDFEIQHEIATVDGPQDQAENARSDIGNYAYVLANAHRLATECRRVGVADTEDEMLQYRWSFDPPESWRSQPTCGAWVNSQAQAMQDGRTWLSNANRRHR